MFIPLHDRNPLRIIPFQIVTVSLIALNVLVFIIQQLQPESAQHALWLGYGMTPAILLGPYSPPPEVWLPAELTLLSYMFLHAGFWHLLGNMLFLWVFGDNIEDAMGHGRFLLFFLACGVLAGLSHGLLRLDSEIPMIGASGATSGVLGAYLMLHPRVKILVLAFARIPIRLPAYLLIGAWLLFQLVAVLISDLPVAWWAHIGGFIAGALLVIPLRDKRIPLFDKGIEH